MSENRNPGKATRHALTRIEDVACTNDFCHICGRCTDHWGEHSDAQLRAWASRPGMLQSLLDE